MRKGISLPAWYEKNRIIELRKNFGYNQVYVAEKIGCVLKTYQNYEQGHNYPTLEYATKLADLYNVSIDYLLGKSDCTTVEKDKIKAITGLSDKAIDTLATLSSNNGTTIAGHNEMNTLNLLLSDLLSIVEFLGGLEDFLNVRYKIPLYHTGETEIIDGFLRPTCIIPNNEYDVMNGTYLLTLAKTKDNPNDNYSIPLTDTFFESVALKTIEKSIMELRSNLKEKEVMNNGSD